MDLQPSMRRTRKKRLGMTDDGDAWIAEDDWIVVGDAGYDAAADDDDDVDDVDDGDDANDGMYDV